MTTEDELRPATVLITRMPSVGSPEDEVESALADRLSRVVDCWRPRSGSEATSSAT